MQDVQVISGQALRACFFEIALKMAEMQLEGSCPRPVGTRKGLPLPSRASARVGELAACALDGKVADQGHMVRKTDHGDVEIADLQFRTVQNKIQLALW